LAAAALLDGMILNMTLFLPGTIVVVAVGQNTRHWNDLDDRFVAVMVTNLIVAIVNMIIFMFYRAYFESSSRQATPGKMIMGIKVVSLNGGQISFWQAFGRSVAQIISGLPLYIGFMMAGWSERKQALHDMICGTLVVNRNTLLRQPES